MKVIGISGLENSVPFKQANWPGLEEREYRIAQGMDAAAALVVDGRLVAAAEEERFSGKKHTGDFPIHAIRFCLAEAGMSIDEIDEIAHGFDYAPYRDLYLKDEVSAGLYNQVFSREALLAQVRRDLPGISGRESILGRSPSGARCQRSLYIGLGRVPGGRKRCDGRNREPQRLRFS